MGISRLRLFSLQSRFRGFPGHIPVSDPCFKQVPGDRWQLGQDLLSPGALKYHVQFPTPFIRAEEAVQWHADCCVSRNKRQGAPFGWTRLKTSTCHNTRGRLVVLTMASAS
jgi:hypothetical protein